MNTIAHLPPANPRMIDLTRSLRLPHGSLSPNTDTEPKWRIEARQDADHFSRAAVYLLVGFIVLTSAIIAHYLRA